MAVSEDTNALTDLSALKCYLGIDNDSNDVLLINLINRVSARIETLANRRFKARDWRFWITATDRGAIVVPQYPLIYVNRVAYGCLTALNVIYSGTEIRATVQAYRNDEGNTGGIRLVSYDSTGSRTTTELTAAANASTNAMATAITAVSGWTGTAAVNIPTLDLYPVAGRDAKSKTVELGYPDQDDGTYRVDVGSAIIQLAATSNFFDRRSASYLGLLVDARCGYETIPADVEMLAHQITSDAYSGRAVNHNLSSESIGDYSYSLANGVQINDDQMAIIASYKDFTIGSA